MALPDNVQAAIARLSSSTPLAGRYNSNPRRAGTNPYGLGDFGHVDNLPRLTDDLVLVSQYAAQIIGGSTDALDALAPVAEDLQALAPMANDIGVTAEAKDQIIAVAGALANILTLAARSSDLEALAPLATQLAQTAAALPAIIAAPDIAQEITDRAAAVATSETNAAQSALDATAAAELTGSYTTLALANAALGSIAENRAVTVTADGANNGFYVKRSGVLVKDSNATVGALDARTQGISPGPDVGDDDRTEIHRFKTKSGYVLGRILLDGGFEMSWGVLGGSNDFDGIRLRDYIGFTTFQADAATGKMQATSADVLEALTAGKVSVGGSLDILPDNPERVRIRNLAGFVFLDSDYQAPVPEAVVPPIIDLTPLYPKSIALAPDRPLPLRVRQIFSNLDTATPYRVTMAATDSTGRPWSRTSKEVILIDPGMINVSVNLTALVEGDISRASRLPIVVDKVAPGVGKALSVLCIGDSITNRQLAFLLKARLEGWGYVPDFIGTMNGSSDTSTSNATGPLGEGREGWALSDYLYSDLDGEVTSVLTDDPADVAAYLSKTKSQKLLVNPFLRPATGGDAAGLVHNGYVFDFAKYMARFAFSQPSVITLGLGMNDVLEEAPSQTLSQIQTLLPQMLDSIRSACPASMIVLWFVGTPVGPIASPRITPQEQRTIVSTLLNLVQARGDTRMRIAPVWAHQSLDDGWAVTGTADAVSGVIPITISDEIHPVGVARAELAEVIAPFCAVAA